MIDRSEKNSSNEDIYALFPKAEVEKLSDKEFETLRGRLKNTRFVTVTSPSETMFHGFRGVTDEEKGREKEVMALFKRTVAADMMYYHTISHYCAIFRLARKLGVTRFYDIGCGSALQGLLLAGESDCRYLGIDREPFDSPLDSFEAEPERINEWLSRWWGERIVYLRKTYPFPIDAKHGALAILSYIWIDGLPYDAAQALNRDFTRVILTARMKTLNVKDKDIRAIVSGEESPWDDNSAKIMKQRQNAMPEFRFYRIAKSDYLFATKHPEDHAAIKKHFLLSGNEIYFTEL